MRTAVIFLVLIFATTCLEARVLPVHVKGAGYAVQSLYLDSLREAEAPKNTSSYEGLLGQIREEAGQSRDIQLRVLSELRSISLRQSKAELRADNISRLKQILGEIKQKKFPEVVAEVHHILAEHYWEDKSYSLALEHLLYSYEIYAPMDHQHFPYKTEFLYQIGGRYYYFRDYKTAKFYLLQAWKDVDTAKVGNGVSKLNTLALCYSNLGEYDSATWYFHKAEELALQNGNELWLGITSGNLGNNYLKQGKADEALPLLAKNIELSRKHNLLDDLALSLSEFGAIYHHKQDHKKDLELQREALEIVYRKQLYRNNIITSRIYPNVAKAYAANGMLPQAYLYLDSAIKAKEKVEMEKNLLYVSGVQHKIDIERHRAALQNKEAEVQHQKRYRNSLIGGLAVLLLFTGVFFIQRNRISREKKISDAERQRSEELLLNILPAEVAEELKATGGARARNFDNVSVLFTDFADFTQISEKLSPQQLVEEIHHCFTAFDKIIERHGLEKIKTIGDAYLAVCGMPAEVNDHAQRTVQAAIEIREYMRLRNASIEKGLREYFHIRIGINSGPVVAGIVGVKKFAYDIWGDTVNTAARMEQYSEEGKINISGSTYELVKHDFSCVHRGKVEAKNKGRVDMYFVE